MNHRKEAIDNYNNVIIDIYNEHGLECLRGLNGECVVNGKKIYSWFIKATKYFQERNNELIFFKILDDLLFISDEIIYFTANVILLEPFINDPIRDSIKTDREQNLYPNLQNR